MASRRRRSPGRGGNGGGAEDPQPRWQLGFKGTHPGQFPPPLVGLDTTFHQVISPSYFTKSKHIQLMTAGMGCM
jgi:hypothetical protein